MSDNRTKVVVDLNDARQLTQVALSKAQTLQELSRSYEAEATVEGQIGLRDKVLLEVLNGQAMVLVLLASMQARVAAEQDKRAIQGAARVLTPFGRG